MYVTADQEVLGSNSGLRPKCYWVNLIIEILNCLELGSELKTTYAVGPAPDLFVMVSVNRPIGL